MKINIITDEGQMEFIFRSSGMLGTINEIICVALVTRVAEAGKDICEVQKKLPSARI